MSEGAISLAAAGNVAKVVAGGKAFAGAAQHDAADRRVGRQRLDMRAQFGEHPDRQ